MNDQAALNKLREICLAFPEAVEAGGVGDPTFKVNGKIFTMRHPHNGRMSMWCKAEQGAQTTLVASDPDVFFVPPYVGTKGWIGVWLDVDLDWDFIGHLIDKSYRMIAPKKLLKLLK